MRVFTKLLKVPFSHLRERKHISVVYVDDSYLQGKSFDNCTRNVIDTVNVLRKLGFTIHVDKSLLLPTQEITFLGFVFNSISMTITLTSEKKEKIVLLCKEVLSSNKLTIRKMASLYLACLQSPLVSFSIGAWKGTKSLLSNRLKVILTPIWYFLQLPSLT